MLSRPTLETYVGDCLSVLQGFSPGQFNVVYVDPPFFTQKDHKLRTRDGEREFSFGDKWESSIGYTEFLYERLQAIRRVMAPNGSLFLHCDLNANHNVRRVVDKVLGADAFQSEIIWYYRRWSNDRRGLLRAHQTIYWYTTSAKYTFNELRQGYSLSTNVDQLLQRRVRDEQNRTVYERDASGNLVTNGTKKGVPLSDVWDIPYLNPKAKERVGYPTQKPLSLLERIIHIASNEGDWILDPFCGSGTTLVAALRMNRNAIGIDVSSDAIELTKKRLESPVKSESTLLREGRESYRNADEKALALLGGLEHIPVQRNKGIDALVKGDLDGTPVPIRVQRENETLTEAAFRLYEAARDKGARVMFVIATSEGGYLPLGECIPPGVIVIDAPSMSIKKNLAKLKSGS